MALTDQLRRLKVDYYEYIALKVIVLLSSNGGEWLFISLHYDGMKLSSHYHAQFSYILVL